MMDAEMGAERKSEASIRKGRSKMEIRSMECQRGVLHQNDGSVRYSQGNSCVIVAVQGPMRVPRREEKIDEATVEILFKPISGAQNAEHRNYEAMLEGCFSTMILSHCHPCTKIGIVVQVVEDDGSILAVAINGVCCALVDAGIQCSSLINAICVAIDKEDDDSMLLDPTAKELQSVKSTITLAFSSKSPGIILSQTTGLLSDKSYNDAINASRTVVHKKVQNFVRRFFDGVFLRSSAPKKTKGTKNGYD